MCLKIWHKFQSYYFLAMQILAKLLNTSKVYCLYPLKEATSTDLALWGCQQT